MLFLAILIKPYEWMQHAGTKHAMNEGDNLFAGIVIKLLLDEYKQQTKRLLSLLECARESLCGIRRISLAVMRHC